MRDYCFGNFLHEVRTQRGLTQYQLGVLVGVSDKAVSKWENGTSKPHSNILYKLSEVLGISVDELLTCKYHSSEKKDAKGVLSMERKQQLWDKAFEAVRNRYGNPVPVEIMNRFLTEHRALANTDMIVGFELLAVLASEAKKQGEPIGVKGATGASFIAYLLGATEVNPLKPHYYCPQCHAVLFDHTADDGWDLPKKKCSCGEEMQSDGHNIPFEAFHHGTTSFAAAMSPSFWRKTEPMMKKFFQDCELTAAEREDNRLMTYKISSDTSSSDQSLCSFLFFADEAFEKYGALVRATATSFERVGFSEREVLAEFQKGNTDGIPEFSMKYSKDMLCEVSPQSFCDLIQIAGLSHGTGVWVENAGPLFRQGVPVKNVIAYRDDVFRHVQEHMMRKGIADTGFAYKIMKESLRGVYARDGMSDEMKQQLKTLEIEDWFVESLRKVGFLFQKAHGVVFVKIAAALMWYKLHYPKEFKEIML